MFYASLPESYAFLKRWLSCHRALLDPCSSIKAWLGTHLQVQGEKLLKSMDMKNRDCVIRNKPLTTFHGRKGKHRSIHLKTNYLLFLLMELGNYILKKHIIAVSSFDCIIRKLTKSWKRCFKNVNKRKLLWLVSDLITFWALRQALRADSGKQKGKPVILWPGACSHGLAHTAAPANSCFWRSVK